MTETGKNKRGNVPSPESLTSEERAYYRETWGFDPVADKKALPSLHEVLYYYESSIPLEKDPELTSAGIMMCARVEVDAQGKSHNRIVFTRGEKSAEIECVHTAVYTASASEIVDMPEGKLKQLVASRRGKVVILPAWEHFVALKSFVSGIAAVGLLWLLDPIAQLQRDIPMTAKTTMDLPFSLELIMQIQHVLAQIVPEILGFNVVFALGIQQLNAGYLERAITYLEQASHLNPSSADAWLHLGIAYESMEKNQQAVLALERAINLGPDHLGEEAWWSLSMARSSIGDREGSEEAMRRFNELMDKRRVGKESISREEGHAAKERAQKEASPLEALTDEERENYRKTWGFDPVAHMKISPFPEYFWYYYNDPIPLENDPELQAIGVSIHAQVMVDYYGISHKSIIFTRGEKSAGAECVRTTLDIKLNQEILKVPWVKWMDSAPFKEKYLMIYPPWEQFTALKSYVAGIVAVGILHLLNFVPIETQSDTGITLIEFTLPEGLMAQLQHALFEIAPELMRPLLKQKLLKVLDQKSTGWFVNKWSYLRYYYDLVEFLKDRNFLNSLTIKSRKKIIACFVHLCRQGFASDEGEQGNMSEFFPLLFSEEILNTYNPSNQVEIFWVIVTSNLKEWIGNHPWFGQVFITLFSFAISYEFVHLLDPTFLFKAIDMTGHNPNDRRIIIDSQVSINYLYALLKACVAIWKKEGEVDLRGLPDEVCNRLLNVKDISPEHRNLLMELNAAAPSNWYRHYLVPLVKDHPNLIDLFGPRLQREDRCK